MGQIQKVEGHLYAYTDPQLGGFLSLEAENPLRAAEVVARLFGGAVAFHAVPDFFSVEVPSGSSFTLRPRAEVP